MSGKVSGAGEAGVISNPINWYFHEDQETEWWHRGGPTREEAIAKGQAEYEGRPFWIAQCKCMVPSLAIFDGDDICERINDADDVWWEDGWTGEPGAEAKRELERRLEQTLKAWFIEFGSLDGACLDEISSEFVPGKSRAAS